MRRASKLHVVLLAGGSGTRFWPASRKHNPKQFLALAGKGSLLARTWKRVRKLAPPTRIWVVAPRALVSKIQQELPALRADRIVVEPSPRDTGPAVGLACATVAALDPGAVVAIFPTDHLVRDEERFVSAVGTAVKEAQKDKLVCLGIRPTHPATGFGYLRCARLPRRGAAVDVLRFVEKPDAARARRFLASGEYLWNAGMFVWRAARFLEELRRTSPLTAQAVEACAAGKKTAWARAPRLSVDYAVMERAQHVRVVPLDADWDDVGSWDAAARIVGCSDGAQTISIGSPGSVVFGDRRLVALVDVPGVTVVDTGDALLVVARDRAERVREVIEELRRRRRKDLL